MSSQAQTKIKGGKWTVFKFSLVSIAYTSVWLAVSSQLGYYRSIHGPQVLLQLNLAYFLPSIPLLIVSSISDRRLEERFGVALTILGRLLVGLLGYLVVCASFPFQPESIWWLLGSTVALGIFGGIAFSASYQLVARFANKNVIALGLGCSVSGPLVLVLQLALQVGSAPTKAQQVWMYESIAVVILAGLWASVSLLLRHWDAVEASSQQQQGLGQQQGQEELGLAQPLLQPGTERQLQGGSSSSAFATPPRALPLSQQQSGDSPCTGSASVLGSSPAEDMLSHPILRFDSVEPFATPFLTEEDEVILASPDDSSARRAGSFSFYTDRPQGSTGTDAQAAGDGHAAGTGSGSASTAQQQQHGKHEKKRGLTLRVLASIWQPLLALFLSSSIALTLFPFFTYVPTSGLLGDSLPKVMFFARIFADVLGRFLPRLRLLAAESPLTVLLAACAKLACVPLFFVYLKSPERWHSDAAAVCFISAVWLLGGYINTQANLMAPKLVPAQHKGKAAGMMAIAYQTAHLVGLTVATVVALALYGSISVDE